MENGFQILCHLNKEGVKSRVSDVNVIREYVNLTDDEIKKLAVGIFKNEYFTSMQIDERDMHLLDMIFMTLAFRNDPVTKQILVWNAVHFYASIDTAAPRQVNGYPIFFDVKCLNQEDTNRVIDKYESIVEFMGDL